MKQISLLIAMIILLGLVCLLLILRLFQYKRQIKEFTHRIRRRRNRDVMSPLEVELFDKGIVELAVALNEYTDEQKELTLQMERGREKLKYVIAGISHDFRTPLTSSYGYMQMVKKSGELSEKAQEYLDISLEKTLYLKELSDEFFEMSTIEAKLKNIEMEKVHLDKLLQECVLGQYDWISKMGIRAEFDIPEKGVYVQGNEYYLKRIVENLFSNMKKYAKTYLKMSLKLTENVVKLIAENDNQNVENVMHHEVADDGMEPMPKEAEISNEGNVDKVFEPFYRGQARDKEGSGLGLYVVKCLATSMEYEVWAEEEDGRFRIILQIPEIKIYKD